jgi:cysteine desulfurase
MISTNFFYFDNASTTKLDQDVFREMKKYFFDDYANPSSLHLMGKNTRNAIELSRCKFSKYINCYPDELIFTSGGSESNNLAIKGFALSNKSKGNHNLL